SVCGLTTGGSAYRWGGNENGQLGDGTTQGAEICSIEGYPARCTTTPVAVLGPTFAALTAGDRHACGVTPAGTAYCWGYNYWGGLGNGTTTNSATPQVIAGGL